MKKYLFIVLVMAVAVYFAGCAKKKETLEEAQVPMSMETLSALDVANVTTKPLPETRASGVSLAPVTPQPSSVSLPPSGPFKPTNNEIQTALKNAGCYTGLIDGKVGPMTRKAVEEFQKANGLHVDGKVGPQTWAVLSKYLNPSAPDISSKKSLKKSTR